KSRGTLADRSFVGTPTSYLALPTCSSAVELVDVSRETATCVLARATFFLAVAALVLDLLAVDRLGAKAWIKSSLRMLCQPAMPFFRAISANAFLEHARN